MHTPRLLFQQRVARDKVAQPNTRTHQITLASADPTKRKATTHNEACALTTRKTPAFGFIDHFLNGGLLQFGVVHARLQQAFVVLAEELRLAELLQVILERALAHFLRELLLQAVVEALALCIANIIWLDARQSLRMRTQRADLIRKQPSLATKYRSPGRAERSPTPAGSA